MNFLNRVHFSVVAQAPERGLRVGQRRIAIHVDGMSLIDLLTAIEAAQARREGAALLAGNYAWPVGDERLLALLEGRDASTTSSDSLRRRGPAGAALLNCVCGYPDCWPLAVRVHFGARTVTWSNFRQLRRLGEGAPAWDYSGLGTFKFDRAGYVAAIAQIGGGAAIGSETIEWKPASDRLLDIS